MASDSNKIGTGCAYVFCAGVAAGGLAFIWGGQVTWREQGLVPGAIALLVIGALMFLGGIFFIGPIRRAAAKQTADAARKAQFPDQPWKWKEEWDGRPIEASDRKGAGALVFFAVAWNAISWPALWAVWWGPKDNPLFVRLMVTLFPLIGVLLVWGAIYKWIQSRKFGRPRFVPSTVPGVIGGYVGGVIEVPARVTPEGAATLTLRNLRRETRGSGKNRSTTEVVLWEKAETIAREKWLSAAGRTDIPVLFYVEPGASASDDRDSDNEVVWRLEAKAATAGVDFLATFEVPVFATGETAPPPEQGQPLLAEYNAGPPTGAALAEAGVTAGADGASWHFSSRHVAGMKIGMTFAALGLSVATIALGIKISIFPALFVAIFAGVFVLIAADLWADKSELRLEGREVVVRKIRPWGTKELRVPRAEVARVEKSKSMAAGSTQYYKLSLIGGDGVEMERPRDGEPFRARKLRHRLRREGDSPALREELAHAPKFEIVFAKHVPNLATAERVGVLVLEKIRGR